MGEGCCWDGGSMPLSCLPRGVLLDDPCELLSKRMDRALCGVGKPPAESPLPLLDPIPPLHAHPVSYRRGSPREGENSGQAGAEPDAQQRGEQRFQARSGLLRVLCPGSPGLLRASSGPCWDFWGLLGTVPSALGPDWSWCVGTGTLQPCGRQSPPTPRPLLWPSHRQEEG